MARSCRPLNLNGKNKSSSKLPADCLSVSVPFQELVFRDIHVKGTLIAGQEYSQQMLNDAAKHGVKVETNIFNGLNEVPKMIELAHSGKMAGKAVSPCIFKAPIGANSNSAGVCRG
jgi:D-arabinose 1-dehydrogenase-like Zn-dependent alcohol dehydrogenase